jgi:Bacteriophage tail sheath protein
VSVLTYAHHTPGVHFEWLDARPPGIRPLRTDVAGFVGIAVRGPLHQPIRVESWVQFTSAFGGHTPQGYLAYAVDGFFANGGRVCWVVRAADPSTAATATLDLEDLAGNATVRLTASSEGTWAGDLRVTVLRTGASVFSLRLELPDGTREQWRDLHLVGLAEDDPRFVETVLNDPRRGSRLVQAKKLGGTGRLPATAADVRDLVATMGGGADGLARLEPKHLIGDEAAGGLWGLATLEAVDEVSVVAVPDFMPKEVVPPPEHRPPAPRCDELREEPCADAPAPATTPTEAAPDALEFPPAFVDDPATGAHQLADLQQALIGHCERLKDRVAILDPRIGDRTPDQVLAWRDTGVDSSYAAVYFPWILVPDPRRSQGLVRAVPPSGHIAGVYARGDLSVGVHRPPANLALEHVTDVRDAVDDEAHGRLNDNGINAIRPFPGRGIRVMGARTLYRQPEWRRYVNVRRLVTMIEEALDEQTQWVVFEPDNPDLWRELDRAVRGLLDGLWRRGMLDGATAGDAYTVRCDASTNPPEQTALGQVTCLVGLQPPWPAEFVVLRVGRTETGTDVVELPGAANA